MPARNPILILNYKTFSSGLGQSGLAIARGAERASREWGVAIMVAVPYTMIHRIASSVEIPVLAQHVDPVEPGRGTGYVTVEAVREAGGRGSLVNHSERKLALSESQRVIELLRASSLTSVACGDTPRAAAAMALLGADIVAVEPPELIGTGIAVSRARPEVVTNSIELIRGELKLALPILVGAGVVSEEDCRRAIELGADGVLVASAVMNAKDPLSKINELCRGLTSSPR